MDSAARVPAWLVRPLLIDFAVAAVLTVMAQAQVAQQHASFPVALAVAAVTIPVAWRRRFPVFVCAAVGAAAASMFATLNPPSVFGEYLAIMLAGFTVAERSGTTDAVLGGILLAGGVVGHDWHSTEYGSPSGLAADLFIPLLVWGLGRVVHVQRARELFATERAATLDRDRLELARLAVEEERRHLARELHDVVTHSLSVVVIQAQAANGVLADGQPEVRAALHGIEAASRSALTDMRRLLGLMRDERPEAPTAPQPRLADLPRLFDRVRGAGVVVAERVDDDGSLDAAMELSIYRIVQEALTNAVKHAPGCHVTVEIARRRDELIVDIVSSRGELRAHEITPGGRGLVGIAERVSMYGGSVVSGPTTDGGFAIRAQIPGVGSI